MAESGNDQILIKIAVFGLTFSLMATMALTVLWQGDGDYNYDEIQGYRDDLIKFSGESMINQSPWVLTHVYTPWISTDGIENHLDENDWLYGQEISDYPYLNKSANIRLDPTQKSTVPITVSEYTPTYEYVEGFKWWADPTEWWFPITWPVGEFFGGDPNEYAIGEASVWNFTGYRFVFDATLPYQEEGTVSHRDDSLSIVWYDYGGQEGISGGLQLYKGSVLLSSYSALDIVADYQTTSAYATTYEFMFDNTPLTLSIRFDPDVIENGIPLMQAFSQGSWSMAISSLSAGNFFDIENSISFTATAGSMIKTFTEIYTFKSPNISNPFASAIVWLLVGLPMTLAMLCITLRLVSAVRVI